MNRLLDRRFFLFASYALDAAHEKLPPDPSKAADTMAQA
jgi:hypothetical protein